MISYGCLKSQREDASNHLWQFGRTTNGASWSIGGESFSTLLIPDVENTLWSGRRRRRLQCPLGKHAKAERPVCWSCIDPWSRGPTEGGGGAAPFPQGGSGQRGRSNDRLRWLGARRSATRLRAPSDVYMTVSHFT